MSAKYRNMVAITWIGPNGPFMLKATTDREVARMCRKHGMPSHVDALRVKVGETRTSADELPLSGQIPTTRVEGLTSVKSRIEDSSGTTAQPMSFVVKGVHDGANADTRDAYIEPGLLRTLWAEYVFSGELGEHTQMPGSDSIPTHRDMLLVTTPIRAHVRKSIEKATNQALGARAYTMCEDGTKHEVPVNGPESWAYRLGTPATYRDGTPKPNPDMYLIYGEKGQNQARLTQEDMNRVTSGEAVEVQRLCKNFTRARDAARITKKSDISSKSDGADMWDAMQDSVLYYAQALKWADSLTVVAFDVNTREPSHWGIIPRKVEQMAADADILGQEFDIAAYQVNLSKKSLMWQAVRNAARDNFSIPDATIRAFKAKFLKTDIDLETGEFGTTLEEYTQITNNGAPGYTLTYPDRFQGNWDGTHQASAEPARSGWTLRLRNGKGGSTRKPQHVAIGTLRTSSDNPYNDVRFRSAWGNGDEFPLLTLALQIGINADDLHKAGVWRQIAQMVHKSTEVSWKQVRDIKAQGRTEWTKLRESLGYLEEMTSGTDAPAAANSVDVSEL